MGEKPGKRLVSRGRYVYSIGMSTSMYSLAGLGYLVGLLVAAMGICSLISTSTEHSVSALRWGIADLIIGALFILLGRYMSKQAKVFEQVMPITRHNTGDLPAVETLVRASDLPPSHQQSELLRAAPQGSETPPEELLRATTSAEP